MNTEVPVSADVVVVGAGIVGCSAAYHLAAAGAGRVLVIDRLAGPGGGSTGACAGGFRHQFTSEVNIRLSQASTPMITGFTEAHGIAVDVVQDGYLFLVRGTEAWAAALEVVAFQRALGVPVETLDAVSAAELIPGLSVEGVEGATFCAIDGIADPSGLTHGYATIARRHGATFAFDTEVQELIVGERMGVRTSTGEISAHAVVLATGAWSAGLAATAGMSLPIEPVPRTIVTTGPFPGVPTRRTLVIDTASSFYLHREAGGLLMGMAGADAPSTDTRVDAGWVAEELFPRAVSVFPPVAEAGLASSWAGLYEMTPDRHPVIGSAAPGLWVAAGFSGHGFQHGPIAGKLLAEMIVDGAAKTVDVGVLAADRFGRGALLQEGRVV
jgi:sarcosine oxidase subunit beta